MFFLLGKQALSQILEGRIFVKEEVGVWGSAPGEGRGKEGRKMERRQLLGKGGLGEGLSVGLYFPCERQRQCQWKERWKWVWEGNF